MRQRTTLWMLGVVVLAVGAALLVDATGLDPRTAAADDEGKSPAKTCLECHVETTPGIVGHWRGSGHADHDVGCFECHEAQEGDLDAWMHEGRLIATVVTPKDCGTCHEKEYRSFSASHHAKGGNILHSLDNLLAEGIEGHRGPVRIPDPHDPGRFVELNGLAFSNTGCQQCHGSQVALAGKDGRALTPWRLELPAAGGKAAVTFDKSRVDVAQLQRGASGQPIYHASSWPNTGIGRLNLDGSRGSCSACHSRHDFSRRRARQPENCGKCHLGPDHPQKEIYEESKHGVAFRDMKDKMNLDAATWVLGRDYDAAPTCATCHMSATRTMPVTHDPRERISWNNRPAVSERLDTDAEHEATSDPAKVVSTWQDKRKAMQDVCSNCHSPNYIASFYKQYDDFVELYNAKYGAPGTQLMAALKKHGLITPQGFDEKIEWTWFRLWHHEGRRARHGAAMMAPDYAHWHGTFEVAERWYQEFVPEIRAILDEAARDPARRGAAAEVRKVLDEILARPEHRYGATGGK